MLERTIGGITCRISLLFPALLTGILLAQGESLAVSCLVASGMHECGHLLAMLAVGCPPQVCTLGVFGLRLEMGGKILVGYRRNILISVAGPLVNLFAAPLLWVLGCRQAAMVHGLLAALNLLPATALDGGQIVQCLLCLTGHERQASQWLRVLSAVVLLPLAGTAFWLALSRAGNATLLIVSGYLAALIFLHGEE